MPSKSSNYTKSGFVPSAESMKRADLNGPQAENTKPNQPFLIISRFIWTDVKINFNILKNGWF